MKLKLLKESVNLDPFNETISTVYSNDDIFMDIVKRIEVYTKRYFEGLGLVVELNQVQKKDYYGDVGQYEKNLQSMNVEASLSLKTVNVGMISSRISCDKNSNPPKYTAWFAYEQMGIGSASEVSTAFCAGGNQVFSKTFKKSK